MAAEMSVQTPFLRLRQVCLVAPQLAPVVEQVQSIFGLPVCHRDPAVAAYGLENALFVCGHAFLEIVAPLRPGTAAGRFLQRSGGVGGYMAIFDCDDPDQRLAQAAALGVRVAQDIRVPGYRGVQLHPRDCRATMISFDRSAGDLGLQGDYHPAGPHWQGFQRLELVRGMPGIELRSPEPEALARHWSGLCDRPLQRDAQGRPLLAFDLGAATFVDAAAASDEHLSALQLEVADPAATMAAATRAGCPADGAGFRLCGVRIDPVAGNS